MENKSTFVRNSACLLLLFFIGADVNFLDGKLEGVFPRSAFLDAVVICALRICSVYPQDRVFIDLASCVRSGHSSVILCLCAELVYFGTSFIGRHTKVGRLLRGIKRNKISGYIPILILNLYLPNIVLVIDKAQIRTQISHITAPFLQQE